MALAPAAAESALRSLSGSLDLPATSKSGAVQVRLGHGVDLHHHGVGVREEQPHLREEPSHVEVVGLLHHELGELQRAGADLGGHAHAGLAGQEPLRVVDLELEVRHGALAHGPLKLGRVYVGVRVPELVGVPAAAAEDGVLGELHHLLGDHAPRRLELPPLTVLELHEARHEGAATCRGVRAVQPLPDLHARGGAASGGSRSPRGAGSSPPWCRPPSSGSRGTSCFLPAGRPSRRAGHGQRHCGRVQDPADGLLAVVVLLAQLGVVGLSEGWKMQLSAPMTEDRTSL